MRIDKDEMLKWLETKYIDYASVSNAYSGYPVRLSVSASGKKFIVFIGSRIAYEGSDLDAAIDLFEFESEATL